MHWSTGRIVSVLDKAGGEAEAEEKKRATRGGKEKNEMGRTSLDAGVPLLSETGSDLLGVLGGVVDDLQRESMGEQGVFDEVRKPRKKERVRRTATEAPA